MLRLQNTTNQPSHLLLGILIITISTQIIPTAQLSPHKLDYTATEAHSKDCYCQGLFFLNQTHIFETCGLYDNNYFRVLEYQRETFTLKEIYRSRQPWNTTVFLQGAVLFKGSIYMMTWREHVVFKMDPITFEIEEKYRWNWAGWGLTTNQTHMFATDGSDTIFLVDEEFKVVDRKQIKDQVGRRLYSINQLQFVDGYIYANIYTKNNIVKIDYEKAKVVKQYDATEIVRAEETVNNLKSGEVINGIAYDEEGDVFVLTGKDWSRFYQVDFML